MGRRPKREKKTWRKIVEGKTKKQKKRDKEKEEKER